MHTYRVNLRYFDGRDQYLLMAKTKLTEEEFRRLCLKVVQAGAEGLLGEARLLTIGLGDIVKKAIDILEEKYGFKRLDSVTNFVTCEVEGPRGYFTPETKTSKREEYGYLESIFSEDLLGRICLYNDETLSVMESRRGHRSNK